MKPISPERLAVVRRILEAGGRLAEAALAIGCTVQNIRRLALHYGIPYRRCPQRSPQKNPKRSHATYKGVPARTTTPAVASRQSDVREYWAFRDPSVVRGRSA